MAKGDKNAKETKRGFLQGLLQKKPKKKAINWDTPVSAPIRAGDLQRPSEEYMAATKIEQQFDFVLDSVQTKYVEAIRTRGEGHATELRAMMDIALLMGERKEYAKAIETVKGLDAQIDHLNKTQPVAERERPSVDGALLPGSVKTSIADAKNKQPVEPSKKFADPIAAEKQIAELLEQRVSAKVKLAEMLRDPNAQKENVELARHELKAIDTALSEAGHKGPKIKELSETVRKGDELKNVYYADTPEKRAESQVHVNEQGLLVDREGKTVSGKHGYVESAEGTKNIFQEGGKKDGKPLHHSSEVAGGAVTAAGEQTVGDGIIREITDKSGHYKPDGAMIHQYVQGLKDEGAKMRDETIVAVGPDGKMRSATQQEIDGYLEVQQLPAKRKELASETEPTKQEKLQEAIKQLEAIQQQLQKCGVGPKNQDAIVQTFKSTVLFNEEEWKVVAGNQKAIQDAIIKKLGMKLADRQPFPSSLATGDELDPNDMEKTNNLIGGIMRGADFDGQRHWVDKSVAYNRAEVEQFAQTGGNVKAAMAKQDVNTALNASTKTNIVKEIDALGGAEKLLKLGFDPTKMTNTQQLAVLEIPGLSGNAAAEFAQLGIKDPSAHAPELVAELLQGVDTLQKIGCFPPNDLWTVEETVEIIRHAKQFSDFTKVKAALEEDNSAGAESDEALKILVNLKAAEEQTIKSENEERKLNDELARLGGVGELAKLVGDPSKISLAIQLEILRSASDFQGLNSLESIAQYGIDPSAFSSVKLLQLLQKAKEINDLGGVKKLTELGKKAVPLDAKKADTFIEILKKVRQEEAQVEAGKRALKDLGFEPGGFSNEKLCEIAQQSDFFRDFGGAEALKKNGIDLSAVSLDEAINMVKKAKVESLGGASILGELGFSTKDLTEEQQISVLQRQADFAGLGGREKLEKITDFSSPRSFTVEKLLQLLQTVKALENHNYEVSGYNITGNCDALLSKLAKGESIDNFQKTMYGL